MLSPYCQDLGLILIRYVRRVTKTAPSQLNRRLSPFLGINNALKKNIIRAKNVLVYILKEHYVSQIYVAFILQLKHVQQFFFIMYNFFYYVFIYFIIYFFIYFLGEGNIIGVIGLLLLVLLCIQSKIKIGLCLLQVAPLVGIQFVTYEITKAFLYGQGLQLPWR